MDSSKNGDTVADYKYNPSGIRIEKKDGDDVTRYHVLSGGLVLAESDKDGNAKAQIIWGHKPIMRKAQGKYYYYIYNGHGDVVQMVSEDGTIVNEYEYDEWGNILKQKETVQNDIKYSGEYYDSESGLYYLRARYYDPTIGRFISRDTYEGSVTNPLSLNLYTYCHNNPVNSIDPSGHDPSWFNGLPDFMVDELNDEIRAFEDFFTPDQTISNKEFKGSGLQLQLTYNNIPIGVEAIWFNDSKMDKEVEFNYSYPVVYVYSGVELNDDVLKWVLEQTRKAGEAMHTVSGSASGVTVWGDKDEFRSPNDYKGEFVYTSLTANHVVFSVAGAPNGSVTTINGGGSTSKCGASAGASYYWMIPQEMTSDIMKSRNADSMSYWGIDLDIRSEFNY